MIRRYDSGDAGPLALIHTAVFPGNPLSTAGFRDYLSDMVAVGGSAWVIARGVPLGYALAAPVPGLPHIAELNGCIAPAWQRQGLGSQLLRELLHALAGTAVRQVAHQVEDLTGAAARFLQTNGFYIEHEEWLLVLEDLRHLPKPAREGASLATFSRGHAVTHFERLYTGSFAGLRWDQPYTRSEIAEMLASASDILFLILDGRPAGFAWLHVNKDGLGVIEPMGILPSCQRQGYGRFLLLAAVQELARRGASRVQIGAWRNNEAAIHLYESLGFRHQRTITYLAYDLPGLPGG